MTIRRTVPRTGLGAFFMEVIPKLQAAIAAQGGKPAVNRTGNVGVGELPGGPAAKAVHIGPYDTLPQEYPRIEAWLTEKEKRPGVGPWESYVDDAATTPHAKLRTEVYWPVG